MAARAVFGSCSSPTPKSPQTSPPHPAQTSPSSLLVSLCTPLCSSHFLLQVFLLLTLQKILDAPAESGASQIIVSTRSALFRRPRKSATSQPQLIRDRASGERRALSPSFWSMGGRAFGPPLCRGCAPATPPSKNMPPRPLRLLRSGAPVLQCACRQPTMFRRKSA